MAAGDAAAEPPPLPGFLQTLLARLASDQTHVAVRCFLGRCVLNCAADLRPWAQHFLAPLMVTALMLARTQQQGGGPGSGGSYNFFMRQVWVG